MGAFDNRTPVNKNASATDTAKVEAAQKAAELEKQISTLEKMGDPSEEMKKSIEGLKKCLDTAKAAAGMGGGGMPAAVDPLKPEDMEMKKAVDEVVAAQKTLGGQVGEIMKSIEALKALLPSNAKVNNEVEAIGTRNPEMPKVEKALEEVTKAVQKLTDASAEQTTRIEKIEKARGAPSSEQPGGGGTVPVKKSLWSGLGLLGPQG